jgi:FtsH-binding integral membrane protein
MSMHSHRTPLDYAPTRDVPLFRFFNQVYAWMFVGLVVTALVGYVASTVPVIAQSMASPGLAVAAALGMFALAWGAQSATIRLGAGVGLSLYILYAALMGLLTSYIYLIYDVDTLVGSFLITGGVFGGMSVVGFVIKKDLSTIGRIAMMCVLGLFAASLFNLFFASNALSWFITYGVLIVFIIITAYKTQDLKNLAYEFADNPEMLNRVAVLGSIMLYITFINLFLSILRIMGSRK